MSCSHHPSVDRCRNSEQSKERKENAHMAQEAIPLEKVATQPKQTSRTMRAQHLAPYLFLTPFMVLFLLFFILPIIYAIYQSLYKSQRSGLGLGAATVSFNGLSNYVDV